MNEQKLIDVLNQIIQNSQPIRYEDFNKHILCKDENVLYKIEEENPEVGLVTVYKNTVGMSTLSIIATITDILCGKRLAFQIEDEFIVGVQWYE